jgi:putative nucleotidyltransferase with HDIG domain
MDAIDTRFDDVRRQLSTITEPAWIVGGAVRDILRGLPVVDVDIAIAADADGAAKRLARAYDAVRFPLSDAFGAWRIVGGALPFQVDITPLQGSTIAEDLSRRDLTVNAIAVALGDGGVVDTTGGLGDLERGVLRMVAPDAFHADPVRIVRLARIALQTGFAIDESTRLRARMDAGAIAGTATERVFDELIRIAKWETAWRGFEILDEVGGLGVIIPQLEEGRGLEQTPYHHKDVLGHTLEVVRHACDMRRDPANMFRGDGDAVAALLAEPLADEMSRGDALMFACLFHDMAKPETYAVTPEGRATFFGHDRVGAELASAWCRRHNTSNRFRETVAQCVREHLALGFMVHRQPLSLRQIVRYLDRTSPADVELIVLSCADRLATDGARTTPPQIARHLDVARQVTRQMVALAERGTPVPLLDGRQILAIVGRDPGPWTAAVVNALREEQIVGLVTTRAQAERFVREWMARDASADEHQ